MTPRRLTTLKALISVVAVAALVARLIWPNLRFDTISLGLLVLIALPWLSGLFDSLEFPGGWKISFRDLEQAAASFPPTAESTSGESSQEPSYLSIRGLDPELALVGLRIEVEKRLQDLAALHDIDQRKSSAGVLARRLQEAGAIPPSVAGGLTEVIIAGNAAAHGATLPSGQRDFAFSEGPRIVTWLDHAISRATPPGRQTGSNITGSSPNANEH